MTKEEFNNIINNDPTITSEGRFPISQAAEPSFQEFRERLREQYEGASLCVDFLIQCLRNKSSQPKTQSTLGVTNYFREWYSYHYQPTDAISEGALIVASIYLKLNINNNRDARVAIGELPDFLDEHWDVGEMRRLGCFLIS